ncbi:MAG TPA: S41 family peptidase [Pyrinomonadaceae bacterium]|nr:S41 family peptidase [Pyrinomonadaceae bacterium]
MTSPRFLIPLITEPYHQFKHFENGRAWDIKPKPPYLKAKKVFIIDCRVISYTETMISIAEKYSNAEIIGETTAGTNGDTIPISLPGGYRLMFTGMKVQKYDGSQHLGVGITPSVKITRTRAAIAAGRDEFLEKALEYGQIIINNQIRRKIWKLLL